MKAKVIYGLHIEIITKQNNMPKGLRGFQKGNKIWLGKKFSEKHKKRLSLALKGRKFSKEHRKKISERQKREKNWNWRGGKSFEPYPIDWIDDLREAIRKRDNYICQICGIHQGELKGFHRKLDIYHKDYNKNNLNPENLISLCRKCHNKTNFNRNYWLRYYGY